MTFAPADYLGLFFRHESDALPVVADGTAVATWADASGGARDFTQATGSKQPLYKVNQFGTLPGLLFDGTDDAMATAAIDLTAWDGLTLYLVLKPVVLPASEVVILESSTNYSSNLGANIVTLTPSSLYTAGGNGATTGTVYENWKPAVAGTANVLTVRFTRTSTRAQVQLFVDGETVGQYLTDTQNIPRGTLANVAWYLGGRAGTSIYANVTVGAVLAYRTLHNALQRRQVETYLGTKYGVTTVDPDAVLVVDSHSRQDADGAPPPIRRHWNRAMTQVKARIDVVNVARAGTTSEKFADDRSGRQRWLETNVATRILMGGSAANDIYYNYGVTRAEAHLQREWADMQSSNATHRTIDTDAVFAPASPPATFLADLGTVNTYIRANTPAGFTLFDYGADALLGIPPDTSRTSTQWFNADTVHFSENPGYTRLSQVYFLPYLTGTVGMTQWTPADFGSDLVLWLDAVNPGTAFANNDPVSTWTDRSGLGNHATASGALRPTYKTNVLGYPSPDQQLPGMLFSGTQGMAIPAINLTSTSAVCVAGVVTASAGATDQAWYEYGPDVDSVADSFVFYRSAAGKLSAYLKGNVGTNSVATTTVNTTPVSAIALYDTTKVAAAETFTRVNATDSGTSGSANNSNAFGNRASYIGSRLGAGSVLPLTGYMGELIVVKRRPTITEQRRLDAYLSNKWSTY